MADLADKYRPRNFAEVVGQDAVVRSLREAVKSGRARGKAYLLSGPSGSGKTTLAHLLAKALNCEALSDGEPCGKCRPCRDGGGLSVLDATNDRRLDAIRQVIGYWRYSPHYNCDVWLLDEAHQLPPDSREALLGPLEKLHGGLTVLFATTKASEFHETLLSRCQVYELKRIEEAAMVGRLRQVAQAESYDLEDATLMKIARKSGGNLRTAMQNLEEVGHGGEAKALPTSTFGKSVGSSRSRSTGGSRGRPSKEQEREQVILRVLKDGERHRWQDVVSVALKNGLKDTKAMLETRRRLKDEGKLEEEGQGRALSIRQA